LPWFTAEFDPMRFEKLYSDLFERGVAKAIPRIGDCPPVQGFFEPAKRAAPVQGYFKLIAQVAVGKQRGKALHDRPVVNVERVRQNISTL